MYARFTLILVLLPLLAGSARAGILFGKKPPPKPDPAVRVPDLIKTVHTDGDENKRADAIAELRQYDPATFPEIMPTLIDALLNDKKPSVRAEAASTIGKLRPVSQQAGDALEQALDKDASMRVRIAVRSALLQYHWAGYRSGKKDDAPPSSTPTTKEPPLADPPSSTPTTKEPPLADPTPTKPTKPMDPPSQMTPRPLPPTPVPTPPAVILPPQPLPQGPSLEPPPVSGPDLGAPPQ